MKVSEITMTMICEQLREEETSLPQETLAYIEALKEAAIAYVMSATGINGVDEADENGHKLDDYEDITIAVMVLISDMYDNRQLTVDKKDINRLAESTINRHRFNLIAGDTE